MEIGHNVLHGQWDWMRDPRIHSSTWEWDYATPAALWKRSHNEGHHVYTNIVGLDNDLGYGIMRVDEAQPWRPRHLVQPVVNLLNALVFEYGIAAYDLELGRLHRGETTRSPRFREDLRLTLTQGSTPGHQGLRAVPLVRRPLVAADPGCERDRQPRPQRVEPLGDHVRALPGGSRDLRARDVPPDETRGEWYLRQMLGSANITGPPLLHVLAGNLSHQIEHHLFPDLPSNRYAEIAPEVRAVSER